MTKTTHLIGGFTVCGIILVSTGDGLDLTPSGVVSCAAAIMVGSLFPDVDIPTSKAGHLVKPASTMINAACGHRGVFHAPLLYLVAILIGGAMWPAWSMLLYAFGIGVASHLILDMLNRNGIPLFWPMKKRISFASVSVGGFVEWLIRIVLMSASLLLMGFYLRLFPLF